MLEVLFFPLVCAFFFLVVAFLYIKSKYNSLSKDHSNKSKELENYLNQVLSYHERIEEFLKIIGEKDVLLQRGADSLTTANRYLEANADLIKNQKLEIEKLYETVAFQQQQYDTLIGRKKSSEVRTGKIVEQMAPIMENYPANPETARFIGEPIDFVHFDEDKVTFVEVKSGNSKLSKKQRIIRDLIKDGKVEFLIYQIKGDSDGPDSAN